MAPNLLLAARKACHPFSWFPTTQDGKNNHYHYQFEPVPGIYWSDGGEDRWLVAIKPNSKKDIDNIFAAKKSPSISQDSEKSQRPTSQAPSTTSWNSSSTLRSSGMRSVSFDIKNRDDITYATKNTHDKCPSSYQNSTCDLEKLYHLFNKKNKSNHVTREDCFGGFRRLAQPLRIAYSTLLNRWMFADELKERTIRISMCGSENCLASRHTHCEWQCAKACGSSKCGVMVKREMFVLDDAKTWIITGDLKHVAGFAGKVMVRREGVCVERSGLFYVNKWEGMTKMRLGEEILKRRELAGLNRDKRYLADDDCEELYVKVVSYLAA